MKYIQIRLYASHDYDLIALSSLPYIKLDDVIHACVCAFVRGEDCPIPITANVGAGVPIKDIRICVTFNEEEDSDVIEWLDSIRHGFLNSALKIITRSFLSPDYLYSLYSESNNTNVQSPQRSRITEHPRQRRTHKPNIQKSSPPTISQNTETPVKNDSYGDIQNNSFTTAEKTIEEIKPENKEITAPVENLDGISGTSASPKSVESNHFDMFNDMIEQF